MWGELRAQTLEPGALGLYPSSVTLLKWSGLSESQFPYLWRGMITEPLLGLYCQ